MVSVVLIGGAREGGRLNRALDALGFGPRTLGVPLYDPDDGEGYLGARVSLRPEQIDALSGAAIDGLFVHRQDGGGAIDVNTAPSDVLQTLDGIGPVRAGAIVGMRPIVSLSDLTKLSGVTGADIDEWTRAGLCVGAPGVVGGETPAEHFARVVSSLGMIEGWAP